MRIVFLAPEIWPFTSSGALGEMAHDLALSLADLGNEVIVITLKTAAYNQSEINLQEVPVSLEIPISWRHHEALVYEYSPAERVKVYFIYNRQLFEREGLYGNAYGDYEDNGERFIFYSRAAIELMLALDIKPDIVHANNWTSGLVPLYLKSLYQGLPGLSESKTLITVHNLMNQGIFWHYDMPLTGLGWEHFNSESLEFYGKINLLKAGLVAADMVCFTSPSYAEHALTPEHGHGLDGVLQTRLGNIAAVINGVNHLRWSPETDNYLLHKYSCHDLDGKQKGKKQLREALNLPDSNRPLLALSGRLAVRRGFEEIAAWIDDILGLDVDVAMVGQGEHSLHVMFQDIHARRGDRFGLALTLSQNMVHLLLTGADMLLLPSTCTSEQTQHMKAHLYGTIPVALRQGVAADSITPHSQDRPGDGFLFNAMQKENMLSALRDALDVWHDRREWEAMMQRAMQRDYAWRKTAFAYQDIYQRMLAGVGRERA